MIEFVWLCIYSTLMFYPVVAYAFYAEHNRHQLAALYEKRKLIATLHDKTSPEVLHIAETCILDGE